METRKVTIINNKSQKQTVIENSTATNLGELKAEMREKGISYEGMTFYEGHMRAELKDDAAPLPTNIPFKGQVVNDLVFLLTAPEKKIKSGAMSRNELIAEAKKLGFPSNPTQAKSAALIEFIESKKNTTKIVAEAVTEAAPKKAAKKAPEAAKVEEAPKAAAPAVNVSRVETALRILVGALYDEDVIESHTRDEVMEALDGDCPEETTTSKKMSQREIDEMFDFAK